ncbi:ribonuclease h [Fusarium longipes]|uniref:ribonuclease H n=1 Tax=Fusarium longipes TaxID=694270 RepID=A0A395SAM0_9HYPO|nr:ribonuclease h [Fusarium longipes]
MLVHFAGVDELLQSSSEDEVEMALTELWVMLKKDRTDPLHLSDIIPHVLLQLGDEQKCYDFIKWCASNHSITPSSYPKTPFFDLDGADVFESPSTLMQSGLGLSHLVALTLLKLRLYLDLDAISERDFDTSMGCDEYDTSIDRPLGAIVESIFESATNPYHITELKERIRKQYLDLINHVQNANPHLWEVLIDEELAYISIDGARGPGSKDEAELILYHCRRAWNISEDAIMMVEIHTAEFTRVHQRQDGTKEADHLQKIRGRGKLFPTEMKYDNGSYPSLQEILETSRADKKRGRTILGRDDQLILWTGGACSNNGQENPRGGWGVWLGTQDPSTACEVISGRLENRGPFGDHSTATSNRAELRAVIAALRLSNWKEERFSFIVIATDSTYVVNGATAWTQTWARNGWRLANGDDVKNRDLWEILLGEVERLDDQSVSVRLLCIPQENNIFADEAAKTAARTEQDMENFTDITLQSIGTNNVELQSYVLVICLGGEHMFRNHCQSFIHYFPPDVEFKPVSNHDSALEHLNGPSPPSMILITDSVIARPRHREVWERVIDHMRNGARVVFEGTFSNLVTTSELQRVFAAVGLRWERSSYVSSPEAELQTGILGAHLTKDLPSVLTHRTAFLGNVDPSNSWYVDPDMPSEAAVAFAQIGSGRLGYIGCLNRAESAKIAKAMFGLSKSNIVMGNEEPCLSIYVL